MQSESIKIIILSPDEKLQDRLNEILSHQQRNILWRENIDQLKQEMESDTYDIFILMSEACKNQMNYCIDVLEQIISKSPSTQILFLVEPQDVEIGIQSLTLGVYQYAKLPISDKELKLLIETALERSPIVSTKLPEDFDAKRDRLGNLVGASAKMQRVYRQICQAASSEVNVLLLGETGTGKDLAAQTIHQLSKRSDAKFLPINLGAVPSDLVASELFGHEKGAFTGALKQSKGIFEKAENGIVFLDEIEAVDEKVQISLLRLIEQKKFRRLGGRQAIENKARLIASSNENLQVLIEKGVFRKDLYYRLDVFRIIMPPLRENLEDIPLLTKEFIARYNRTYKKNITAIAPECIQVFQQYDWPGNARELKNVIQRAAIVCEGDEIRLEHLPPRFRTTKDTKSTKSTVTFEIGTPLEQVEKEMILRALSLSNNNRTQAAELLGISRRAIYNKLRKHNIQ
jgi:DNA-binding NtrC family response regulator